MEIDFVESHVHCYSSLDLPIDGSLKVRVKSQICTFVNIFITQREPNMYIRSINSLITLRTGLAHKGKQDNKRTRGGRKSLHNFMRISIIKNLQKEVSYPFCSSSINQFVDTSWRKEFLDAWIPYETRDNTELLSGQISCLLACLLESFLKEWQRFFFWQRGRAI